MHELTHAKFAESIDPLFSAPAFHPSLDRHNPHTRQQMQMVQYSQLPVEIWVSDYMATIDPKIAEEDITTVLIPAAQMPGEQYEESPLDVGFGYALNYGELVRRKLDKKYRNYGRQALTKIYRHLGAEIGQTCEQLGTFFAELPELPMDPTQALPLLEQAAQETARIVRFPIRPSLTQHESRWVWQMEDAS